MSNSAAAAAAATADTTLYVLKLSQGKYYVGSTNNIDRRFAEHLNGEGSEWTRQHEPVEIVETSRGNRFQEDALVLKYMSFYGIENVRGGTYSSLRLPDDVKHLIERQLRHAGNQCFHCGSSDHFASQCPGTRMRGNHQEAAELQNNRRQRLRESCPRCGCDGHTIENCCSAIHANGYLIESGSGSEQYRRPRRRVSCTRCGRDGHTIEDCFSAIHANGYLIEPGSGSEQNRRQRLRVSCTRCGRDGHTIENCFSAIHANGYLIESGSGSEQYRRQRRRVSCTRCGRDGHTIEDCFAATHVNIGEETEDEDSDDDTAVDAAPDNYEEEEEEDYDGQEEDYDDDHDDGSY